MKRKRYRRVQGCCVAADEQEAVSCCVAADEQEAVCVVALLMGKRQSLLLHC